MNVVLVMFKDNERREFPLSGEKTVIGRRQDCQLRIPTKDVSRQHCVLIMDGTSIVAKDLGSSNGTFVNGRRVQQYRLASGDQIQVGSTLMLFTSPAEAQSRGYRPPKQRNK